MRDKILDKAVEMFINIGFKSVTMDDISTELSISKKTLYTHFSNKNELVKQATFKIFDVLSAGITKIIETQKCSIEELFEIKSYVMKYLNDEKSSPNYQLQKFYPEVFEQLNKKRFDVMSSCVDRNIERGIEEGVFRKEIDLGFITRIYFSGMDAIQNEEIFPSMLFDKTILNNTYLDYHIRSIATEKGIKILEQIIENENNK